MSVDVKTSNFRPLELNERNVSTLFKRCLADENCNDVCYAQVLIPDFTGRFSDPVKFSRAKIVANRQTIVYILGQIKSFHTSTEALFLQEGFMRYDNEIWTQDYDTLFKLYNMAMASAAISEWVLSGDLIGAIKSPICVATLSPRDPNFSEWYEEYKEKHPELF